MKCFNKIKSFVFRNKVAVAVSAIASAIPVVAINASAADGTTTTSNISTALTNGLQSATNDLITYAVAVVPICITAFGVTWAIKKCVNFFKGVTGR